MKKAISERKRYMLISLIRKAETGKKAGKRLLVCTARIAVYIADTPNALSIANGLGLAIPVKHFQALG